MKIKIRTEKGWRSAPAFSTTSPQLFVTPHFETRRRKNGESYNVFSKTNFVVTHRRTGTRIGDPVSKDMAMRAATLLALSGVPWQKIRSQRGAKKYGNPLCWSWHDDKPVAMLRARLASAIVEHGPSSR